jgi:hypothetical protein
MLDLSSELKKQSKQETRSSRIAEKERERNEMASTWKKQHEEQTATQNFSTLIQLQGLKLLKSFMDEEGSGEEATKAQDQTNAELKSCYEELSLKQSELQGQVENIQSSLTEILYLLKK